MSGRSRHQLGVLLLVLLVILVTVGCGGGSDETTTTTMAGGGSSATTAPAGSEPEEESLEGQLVEPTKETPAEFADVFKAKPIVLFFYVPGSAEDMNVQKSLDRLDSSFQNYTFLEYDYKLPDAYGDLSSLYEIGYPPQLVLIDKTGVVREIWNGYVDQGSLNQALVNLGKY